MERLLARLNRHGPAEGRPDAPARPQAKAGPAPVNDLQAAIRLELLGAVKQIIGLYFKGQKAHGRHYEDDLMLQNAVLHLFFHGLKLPPQRSALFWRSSETGRQRRVQMATTLWEFCSALPFVDILNDVQRRISGTNTLLQCKEWVRLLIAQPDKLRFCLEARGIIKSFYHTDAFLMDGNLTRVVCELILCVRELQHSSESAAGAADKPAAPRAAPAGTEAVAVRHTKRRRKHRRKHKHGQDRKHHGQADSASRLSLSVDDADADEVSMGSVSGISTDNSSGEEDGEAPTTPDRVLAVMAPLEHVPGPDASANDQDLPSKATPPPDAATPADAPDASPAEAPGALPVSLAADSDSDAVNSSPYATSSLDDEARAAQLRQLTSGGTRDIGLLPGPSPFQETEEPDQEEILDTKVDYIYENQRWRPLIRRWTSTHRPIERFPWSSENGRRKRSREDPPPSAWEYTGPWVVDDALSPSGASGWQYGNDVARRYTAEPFLLSVFRRRRWKRTRVLKSKVDVRKLLQADSRTGDSRAAHPRIFERLNTQSACALDSASHSALDWLGKGIARLKLTVEKAKAKTQGAAGKGSSCDAAAALDPANNEEEPEQQLLRATSLDGFVDIEYDEQQTLTLLASITKVAPKGDIDEQHFICAGCQAAIPVIDLEKRLQYARLDEYDGKYYCTSCHLDHTAAIPACILSKGDFSRKPVSERSLQLLSLLSHDPIISRQMFADPESCPAVAPLLCALEVVDDLRKDLERFSAMFSECQAADMTALRKMIWPREHLLADNRLYSIADLLDLEHCEDDTVGETLIETLMHVVDYCHSHAVTCARCTAALEGVGVA